jgi:hypothetical protein
MLNMLPTIIAMVVSCPIDVELNNLCTWVCTFGSAIISLALFGEIYKLPFDLVNSAHMVFSFLLFSINVSNLRNSEPKMIERVGSSSTNEGFSIEFHA